MTSFYYYQHENQLCHMVKPDYGETRSLRKPLSNLKTKCGGTWMSVVLGPGYGNTTPTSNRKCTPKEGIVNDLNDRPVPQRWVWGHMLNAAWGGFGEYKNVVPLTANGTVNSANRIHRTQVEQQISDVLGLSQTHVLNAQTEPKWFICVKYDVEIVEVDPDSTADYKLVQACKTLGANPSCLPRGIKCDTKVQLHSTKNRPPIDLPLTGITQDFIERYLPSLGEREQITLINAINRLPPPGHLIMN